MALVLKDRVREQSATTGTGTITLAGAYDGYRTFASCIPTGSTVYYCIHNTATGAQDEWEVGYGTFTLSGETLSRVSVMASSNSGSAVDFSAGTKEVFITYPAEKAVYEETNGETLIDGGPITVVGQGVTSIPALPAELGKFVGNVDLFAQIYNMNQNDGSSASADFVAYNDLTTDGYTNFIDMGINSSNYTSVDYPIFTPGSGYLFHDGDKLFIGTATSGKDVVVFAGGVDTANVALTVSGTDLSVTLVGDLNVGGDLDVTGAATFGSTVTLNADPTLALQAATKQYVDNATSNGFHVHTPVLVATTGNLTATYNNGTSGVGATLTNSGAQAALSVDGVSLSVNDRVLVWQQTTGTQNGVYTVTTVGDGSTNWVLTRATDADTAGEGNPNSLGGGDYFFVSSGATLGFFSFVCTNTDTITFGTTAITFTEFSQVPSYVVNAPLNLSGNTLSLTGTVAATNGGTGTATVAAGDLLYGSGTDTWGKLAKGAGYKPLVMNAGGTAPEWNALALNQSGTVSGALPAANGGTGQTTYTLGDTLYSSAANTLSKLAGNTTTTKKYLSQTGNGTASAAPSWDQVAAADISGLAASATTDTTNASNISSGTLGTDRLSGSYTAVTGVGTLTAGTWQGTTIAASYGGTGQSSYAVGDLLYASTTSALSKLADVAVGNALISGGVGAAPAWGKINLTTHISGTLGVGNGGTGATTLTGYVYGNGTGAMTASTTISGSAISGNISGSAGSVANTLTRGSYLTGSNFNGSAATTWDVDATSANTASKVVARDGSGNFSAGTITATLLGNATSATTATTAGTAGTATTATNIAGGLVGYIPYQSAASTTALLAPGTSGYVLKSNGAAAPSWTAATISGISLGSNLATLTRGTYLTGSNYNGSAATTWAVDATDANTASKVVARDASGNFSAGTITATLNGNASTATSASSATTAGSANAVNNVGYGNGTYTWYQTSGNFQTWTGGWASHLISNHGDGSTYYNQTIIMPFWSAPQYMRKEGGTNVGPYTFLTTENYTSYSPSLTGTGASGTWGISISGNASTATTLETARTINGTSFNGSANITVEPYVEQDSASATRYLTFVDSSAAGYQRLNVSTGLLYNPATNSLGASSFVGNASTATTLQTARTINGTSFNGSANITVPVNTTTQTGSAAFAVPFTAAAAGNNSMYISGAPTTDFTYNPYSKVLNVAGAVYTTTAYVTTVNANSVGTTYLNTTNLNVGGPGYIDSVTIWRGTYRATGDMGIGINTIEQAGGGVTAVGYQAARYTGFDNVAVGYQALYGTSGSSNNSNTAIGANALRLITTGSTNTAVGRTAGYSITTGGGNTIVGYAAGYSTTTGVSNVLLGSSAGSSVTTGSYNVVIGGSGASYCGTTNSNIVLADGGGIVAQHWTSGGNVIVRANILSVTSGTTLTAANLTGNRFLTYGTAATGSITLPTAADIIAGVPFPTNWYGLIITVINSQSFTLTINLNTGITAYGSRTVTAGYGGTWMIVKTSATTCNLYRLSGD